MKSGINMNLTLIVKYDNVSLKYYKYLLKSFFGKRT